MPVDVSGTGIGSPSVSLTVVNSTANLQTNITSTAVSTSTVSVSAPLTNPQDVIYNSVADKQTINVDRLDLQNLDVNIIPKNGANINLGSAERPFNEVHISAGTLRIGGSPISMDTVGGQNFINLGSSVIIGENKIGENDQIALGEIKAQLTDLNDVNITNIQDGQGIQYNASSERFENVTLIINTLNDISDVDTTGTLNHGMVLAFDSTVSKFRPTSNIASSIEDLSNIDTTGKTDGSVLKYNSTTEKFEIGIDNTLQLGTTSGTALAGDTVIPTALSQLANDVPFATKTYVDSQVSGMVDAAPGALDTLNELAAAIGDDANFSTTITNSLATKAANSYVNTQLNLKVDQSTFVTTAMNNISSDNPANNTVLVYKSGNSQYESAVFDVSLTNKNINQLQDVSSSTPANNQILVYDDNEYVPKTVATALGFADISSLADVSTQTPTANQILVYNGSQYVPSDQSGGGGGSSTLSDLTDTQISGTPTNGHALVYNAAAGKWLPASVSASGSLTGQDVKDLLEDVDGQVITATSVTASTAGTYVGDSFSINTLRSAKYVVTINDSDDTTYYIAELLLIHNGSTVSFTIYGEVVVGDLDIYPTYSTDVVSSNVRLLIQTTSDSQTIKISRIGSKI